jgi:hypothetical protein
MVALYSDPARQADATLRNRAVSSSSAWMSLPDYFLDCATNLLDELV